MVVKSLMYLVETCQVVNSLLCLDVGLLAFRQKYLKNENGHICVRKT